MPTPELLDFDAITRAIPGDSPAGPDLRRDYSPASPYRAIKSARDTARRLERLWSAGPPDEGEKRDRPDWRPVSTQAPKLLSSQSKDLELAAWLTEALVREHGFAGARDGFRLCRELIDRFWDHLHPAPDPDDPPDDHSLSRRVAPLGGLNGVESEGTLITPLLGVSIVDPALFGAIGVAVFEQATALEQIPDARERERRIRDGAIPLANFQKAFDASPPEFYRVLSDDLAAAMTEFDRLGAALDSRCPNGGAPPVAALRDALGACARQVEVLAAKKLGPLRESAGNSSLSTVGMAPQMAAAPPISGPIQSREQAFALLRQVADFFRQTEPQSILPWQLEECVRFGRMSLPDLFMELIADSNVRESLFKRVGIPSPRDGS